MNDQTILPPNTVVGRTGLTAGPAEALPFAVLQGSISVLFFNQINEGSFSGGTVNINVASGPWHRFATSGPVNVTITGWPSAPTYAEIEIEVTNGGSNITWPTINWIKGDGTNSTTFSSMGVVFNTSGTNWVVIWSRDGGLTLWGKAA